MRRHMMGHRPDSRATERTADWIRSILVSLTVFFISAGPSVAQPSTGDARRSDYDLIEHSLARIRGEQTYIRACAACHGAKGDGMGPASLAMDPPPSNFSSGIFKFRSTPTGDFPTIDDLVRTISNGVPRSMMPAWMDLLTEQELIDVAIFVMAFVPDYYDYEPVPPLLIPPEPSGSEVVFAEGKYLYMVMDCWTCHGVSGTGHGPQAGTLKDAAGRKIKAFDFTRGRYKGGTDNESIFRTFNTGMDGTPMPSYADVFLFGSDSYSTLDDYQKVYSEAEIEALRSYFASQPTEEEIDQFSSEEKAWLAARRKWSLVYFAKSLARKPGLFYNLFKHDYAVTQ